ncbi:tryptophan--tRNA ligase, mitochondrial [Cylas formicarius]|uniref:tryptophan--tRNA ligase, mitochondrial n=1 Tax=Cylas formicarius TaxID=197179 RepID=UPI0029586942|nr:tryptophan--tRNA ligase, mitochondrial [Cylas formicarius]
MTLIRRYHIVKKFFSSQTEIPPNLPEKCTKRILSGIQPTGALHLGNYVGAVAQWLKLQDKYEIILSIADLHSMTLPYEPKQLSKNILELTATLLGCGINPNRVILFQQSSVPAHTELYWSLGCISTMARLAHLPQFKEKSVNLKEIPLGLLVYPVLQAADILCYKATDIPVGEDQLQHIQLTQDLARIFNNRFGATFPIPHSLILENKFIKLRSLRDPSKKMSKSDPDPKSRICLLDTPDHVLKKIKRALTDFTSEVTYDPKDRLGVSNLIDIHSFVSKKSVEDICREAENINTGQYKNVVARAVVEFLDPIQKSTAKYLQNEDYLLSVLESGRKKASELAEQTLDEVRMKSGLKLSVQKVNKIKASL